MRRYRFVQLDVFTDAPFMGNPLAVFPDAEGLSGDDMQRIAREMNLSETTFVLPSRDERAAYRVRIFTPHEELPYAGHPSVGTAWLLASEGRIEAEGERTRFHQDVDAGVLPIDVEAHDGRVTRVFSTQTPPIFEAPHSDPHALSAALGIDKRDLHPSLPAQVVSTGVRWFIVPLASVEALGRVDVAPSTFGRVREAVDCRFVYPFAMDGDGTRARGIVVGEFEDPVTGSASGCLGAYLAKHRALPARDGKVSFVNSQGTEVKRPGLASVEVALDDANEPREVRVGGAAVEVLRGELTMP